MSLQQAEQLGGKHARTRERILDAAIACFEEVGIRRCNMVGCNMMERCSHTPVFCSAF